MELQTDTHHKYLNSILNGKKSDAEKICKDYINQGNSIKNMYENVMKPALYEVGTLWEQNKISIATEHLSTAISEGILNSLYTSIIPDEYSERKVVLACVEGEDHQVGIKMVADIFEMNKWESFFLGNGFPTSELIKYIDEVKPDMIAISLSVYFNFANLKQMIKEIKYNHTEIPVMVGGQALIHVSEKLTKEFPEVTYISDLNKLEEFINNFN